MHRPIALLFLALTSAGLMACSKATPLPGDIQVPASRAAQSPQAPLGKPWVEVGGKRYEVEIAADFWARQKGLMKRRHLPVDHGMLFIHDEEAKQAYWMKNTWIPLDILYFNNRLELVAQQRNAPPCPADTPCPSYPSEKPARYVLELNAGQAEALGLKNGDRLTVRPDMLMPSP